jgi:large repetitive protein
MPDTVTTYENTAVIIPVLANDINTSNEDSKRDDNNNTINIESASEPSDGTSSINENGTITYTPNSNFIGQDSFEYTISNEDDQIDTAMVTVTVQDQRAVESSAVQEEPEEEETSEDSDD